MSHATCCLTIYVLGLVCLFFPVIGYDPNEAFSMAAAVGFLFMLLDNMCLFLFGIDFWFPENNIPPDDDDDFY
jgi:hypothetical protein